MLKFPVTPSEIQKCYQSAQLLSGTRKTSEHFNLAFGALPGMWTDDASQMLCLIETLIAYNGKVNSDQLNWALEFWWNNGYCIGYSK